MSTRSLRYNTMNRHLPKSRLASTDRDALAFLQAATIYNENHQRAIIDLVRRLKSAGLWTKMKAIYPLIGGTATTHKWNLKDPRDVDAAFRILWYGGYTHSNTGVIGSTNTYGDTSLFPSSTLANASAHISAYIRTNTHSGYDIASLNNNAVLQMSLVSRWSDDMFYSRMWNANTNSVNVANSDSKGYYITTRTSTTSLKSFRNNQQFGTTVTNIAANFADVNAPTHVVGLFYGGNYFPTTHETSFITIGDGLTDTEATALYNIVDLYQKRLGRAV